MGFIYVIYYNILVKITIIRIDKNLNAVLNDKNNVISKESYHMQTGPYLVITFQ